MKINIEDIKKLREKTGAGMSDCREALEEAGGDMEKAIKKLRDLGIKRAEKKAEREVKAGAVFSYVHHTGRLGSMVALACETDFVAKTDDFQKLGKELSKKVSELILEVVGKLGENVVITDFKVVII